MRKQLKENDTFPQRLGKAAKNVASFGVGMPIGVIVGIIPGAGFLLGGLAITGHLEQNLRFKNEDLQTYQDRLAKNKKHESLSRGMTTGVVIGMIGQIVAFAKLG